MADKFDNLHNNSNAINININIPCKSLPNVLAENFKCAVDALLLCLPELFLVECKQFSIKNSYSVEIRRYTPPTAAMPQAGK